VSVGTLTARLFRHLSRLPPDWLSDHEELAEFLQVSSWSLSINNTRVAKIKNDKHIDDLSLSQDQQISPGHLFSIPYKQKNDRQCHQLFKRL
jgi:hypothetical protein